MSPRAPSLLVSALVLGSLTGCWRPSVIAPPCGAQTSIWLVASRVAVTAPDTLSLTLNTSPAFPGCPAPVKATFYAGSEVIGEAETAPYALVWSLVPGRQGVPQSGSADLSLSVALTFADGARTTSRNPVLVRVQAAPR